MFYGIIKFLQHERNSVFIIKTKTIAFARARVTFSKVGKKCIDISKNYGSYLTATHSDVVSSASDTKSNTQVPLPQEDQTNQQILILLQDLPASNRELAVRMDRMEQNATMNSTPVTSTQGPNHSNNPSCISYQPVGVGTLTHRTGQ